MANASQDDIDEIRNQSASVPVADSTVNDVKYVSNMCLMSNLVNAFFLNKWLGISYSEINDTCLYS